MTFEKTVTLKDGRNCLLRNGVTSAGKAVLEVFNRTHEETDYLLTYSDENRFTVSQEADFLQRKTDSANNVEIIVVVDDVVAGTAGIDALGMRDKIKHRAVFGIAITKEFWGLGIGKYLMEACIELPEKLGIFSWNWKLLLRMRGQLKCTGEQDSLNMEEIRRLFV